MNPDIRNIVILTGAGISAESGLATFRGPDGLWEGHRVEDVCTPEAIARNPALVHRFYDERRAKLDEVAPNAAHGFTVDLPHTAAATLLGKGRHLLEARVLGSPATAIPTLLPEGSAIWVCDGRLCPAL